jgi:hypothetical protein
MFGWIKSFVVGARKSSSRVVAELNGLAAAVRPSSWA